MKLTKTLNAVGRDVFVKYFYVFGNMADEDCMELFTENYTEKSKKKESLVQKLFSATEKNLRLCK